MSYIKQNRQLVSMMAIALLLTMLTLTLSIAHASPPTHAQGEQTGCSIGSSENYYRENWNMYVATLDLASQRDWLDYKVGVQEGYANCRAQRTPSGGRPDVSCHGTVSCNPYGH